MENDDENSPLSFGRSGDGPTLVDAFQIKGLNRSKDPVSPTRAFIKSNVDGKILPLDLANGGALVPVSDFVIAPNREFTLIATLPSNDSTRTGGLPATVFHREYASFSINFEYDNGEKIERRFEKSKVDRLIEKGNRLMNKNRPLPPSILPKNKPVTPAPLPAPQPTTDEVTSPKPWTDEISDWSVSIETLPLFRFIPDKKIVVFQQFRLVNVSTKYKRIIDLEISVPPEGDRVPGMIFKTEYYKDSVYRQMLKEAGKENKSRGWVFLNSPIELQPGQLVEGQIDFILPDPIISILNSDPDGLRIGATTITVIDRISGNKLELLFGEHFNAVTGKRFDPRHPEKYEKKATANEPAAERPAPLGTRPEDIAFTTLLAFEFPNASLISEELIEKGRFTKAKFMEFVTVQYHDVSAQNLCCIHTKVRCDS